jgi:nucleoside-diphosphate-sugar epimerase
MNQLHTVLGASGATGHGVIKELQKNGLKTRAVTRSKPIEGVETVNADLLNQNETLNAIKDSSHVYLCAGLPYSYKVWNANWPVIMNNVINACSQNNAVLIFFDNIYMYGPSPLPVPFDENTAHQPVSKKGKVRKIIAGMFMEAIESGKIKGLIARSADFYGVGAVNSMFYISILDRMLAGKNPQSIGTPGIKHTYANVTDNARAIVKLALDESAYGETWHLPVGEPITFEEIVSIMNKILGTSYTLSYMPNFLKSILKIFVPILGEVLEMSYQFSNEYNMSFDKFKKKFPDFVVTPYEDAISDMIESFKLS